MHFTDIIGDESTPMAMRPWVSLQAHITLDLNSWGKLWVALTIDSFEYEWNGGIYSVQADDIHISIGNYDTCVQPNRPRMNSASRVRAELARCVAESTALLNNRNFCAMLRANHELRCPRIFDILHEAQRGVPPAYHHRLSQIVTDTQAKFAGIFLIWRDRDERQMIHGPRSQPRFHISIYGDAVLQRIS